MFKPYNLTPIDGKTSCLAVDGGLVMNNPTYTAVTRVLHNKRDFPSVNGVEDLMIFSIGNGPLNSGSPNLRPNGDFSMSTIIGITLDGISETIDQMIRKCRKEEQKEAGSGPTAAVAAAAAQKQKPLLERVGTDIGNIVNSFLVNHARVNDVPVRNSQDTFTMEMRAAMVQVSESLLKLVTELKQTAIFSGLASLNDHVEQRIDELNKQAQKID